MRKIAKGQTENTREVLLFHGLGVLARSDSEILSWPNCPLLVLLKLVDEDAPLQEGESIVTPLHSLADLASTHKDQLILAKQLIEQGANVNAVSSPHGSMPLHNACYSSTVTNLDFVKYLLKKGADPDAQDHLETTPLMWTAPYAPSAAKLAYHGREYYYSIWSVLPG
jgi:hypothetical protein